MEFLACEKLTQENVGNCVRNHRDAQQALPRRKPDLESNRVTDRPSPTALLEAWGRGDRAAFDALVPLVHDELKRIARHHMRRERGEHTLQPSALVNEAYIRLLDVARIEWQNRAHFFAMAARVMRRILVDSARARKFQKRGGGAQIASLDEALVVSTTPGPDLVALDDALNALSEMDPRKAQVVEMRFFGGLSAEETAEALHVSLGTVMRDWRLAKVWMLRELSAR
jgi:RNA polymerase sigma-70 factor (ECF subfamily)